MIREIVTTRAAKLIAACVCPVAGAGTLTVTVPEVRQAVHRATAPRAAPRQIARPQTRPRPPVQQAVALPECPPVAPVILTSNAFTPTAQISTPPISFGPGTPTGGNPVPPGAFVPVTPIGFIPLTPPPPGPPGPPANPVPVVPEPATWLQMIVGFGIVGGAVRIAWRRKDDYVFEGEDEAEA